MDPKSNGVQSNGTQDAKPARASQTGVQGEGNYDATHHYNEGLRKSVQKGNTDDLAQKAKRALEGDEGDELRKADQKANSESQLLVHPNSQLR